MYPLDSITPYLESARPRPIYEPRNHSKQSYAAQNRAAKKRRNNRQKRK